MRRPLLLLLHLNSLFLFLFALTLRGDSSEEEKGLFYYVVDQSSSITHYGLTEPIRQAITNHAYNLPDETEVRLVFFSGRATDPRRWERMSDEAKADFESYFADTFQPHGPTRLYDTVGEVFEELAASSEDYRFVSVLIFSDGANNWSSRFRNWRQLEPVFRDLEQRHEHSFVYWVTMEFEPAQPPPSWIRHLPQPPGATDIPVPEPPPVADFRAYPSQLKAGETVQFELLPKGGRIEEVEWDFGDGGTSAEMNPSHQYENDGIYDVTLRTAGPGGSAEEVKEGHVEVSPVVPLTAAFAHNPERPRIGSTLRLEDRSEGNPDEREWRVGGDVISSERTVAIELDEAGEKTITLVVTRGTETAEESVTVTVLPPPPSAEFVIQPEEAEFDETVVFSAVDSQDDWTHSWTIDGDVTLEGAQVEWNADRHGLINVIHAVEGPGGRAREASRIYIHPPVEVIPDAGFTMEPRFFHLGDTVVLTASETGEGRSHQWLVDGEPIGEGAEIQWEVEQSGNLSVTHRVQVPESDAVFEETAEALAQEPALIQVGFSASTTSGVAPLEVAFTDESVGNAVAYEWDFGDGETSAERNPTHLFDEPGDYTVSLSVTNPRGEVTTSAEPLHLSVAAPMPAWQKAAIGAVVAGVLWIALIIPFILRPLLGLQKGPKLVGVRTYHIHHPARRGWKRLLWPKRAVTVGSALRSDIRLAGTNGGREDFARISRVPGSSSYRIHPLGKHPVYRIVRQNDPYDGSEEERSEVRGSRVVKNGDLLEIGGERLAWRQPVKRSARRPGKVGRKPAHGGRRAAHQPTLQT